MTNWYNPTDNEVQALMKSRGFIPDMTLSQAVAHFGKDMQIFDLIRMFGTNVTMDYVVTCNFEQGQRFLLLRRAEPPFKGQLFFPGGRLRHGEDFTDGLMRNVKRELGIAPCAAQVEFKGSYPLLNPEGVTSPEPYFTVPHMHLINLSEEAVGQIQMDSTSTEQVWVEFIPDDAPKQLERGLRMVGMKKCGE